MEQPTNYEKNSLIYLIAKPLFLGIGFTRMLELAGATLWLSIIIGTIFGSFLNYIFTLLPDKNNKFFTTLYSFSLLAISIALLTNMLHHVYLNETPIYLLMIPLLLLVYYVCTKKIETIYRSTSIILMFNAALALIAFGAIIPNLNFNNFSPFFASGPAKILKAAIEFAMISTTPYILLPNYKKQYNYKAYLTSCFTLLLVAILIIGELGTEISLFYDYPEYMIFKRISIFDYLENVENFLFSIWFFAFVPLIALAGMNIKKNTNNFGLIIALLLAFGLSFVNHTFYNFLNLNLIYILVSLLFFSILSRIHH